MRAVVAAFVLLIAAALLLPWFGRAVDSSASVGERIFESQGGLWVNALQEGAEVRFVREDATASLTAPDRESKPRLVLRGLGPLPGDSISPLREQLDLEAEEQVLAQLMTKAESGDPVDYLAFLRELYTLEKLKVARSLLDKGDYVVLKTGSPLPPVPHDYGVYACIGAATVNGERADVWFFIDLSEHHEAAAALKIAEEFESLQADEDVRSFNLQDESVRRAAILAHDEATRALQAVSASGGVSVTEHRRQLLPSNFKIDRQHWLVSKIIRRRH